MAEWNEGAFTDESRICLQHHDGRIRVWRHRGERRLISCVTHRHTGPAPSIMIIDLHTETEKSIVELLTKLLPHHCPLVSPCFRAFASFESKDVYSDHLKQEAANGKGAFIQDLWALYAKSKLYSLNIRLGNDMVPQT
ncbi:uncharacterized protein TNCV_533441 [Trichonephila clavipes]|nr:uncharacterized protein TNCV_533441 [Trichonephila clavipes]